MEPEEKNRIMKSVNLNVKNQSEIAQAKRVMLGIVVDRLLMHE